MTFQDRYIFFVLSGFLGYVVNSIPGFIFMGVWAVLVMLILAIFSRS